MRTKVNSLQRRRPSSVGDKGRKVGKFIIIFLILLVPAIFMIFLKLNTKYWNGTDKVSFVYPDNDGNINVTVLDPGLNEKTTLVIPGDTEVDVARNYGQLRIKNVWKLGINENLGGELTAQTVTENFLFPTVLWSSKGLDDTVKFVLSPGNNNIPLGDRINMAIFAMKVKSIDTAVIDLGKSQFLKKQNLTDGLPGYTLNGPVSARLTVYFADNYFSNTNIKIGIVDSTGSYGTADTVGSILEVLGGKIVSIDHRSIDNSLNCNVLGNDKLAVKKISQVMNCKILAGKSDFDAELQVGGLFAKNF